MGGIDEGIGTGIGLGVGLGLGYLAVKGVAKTRKKKYIVSRKSAPHKRVTKRVLKRKTKRKSAK